MNEILSMIATATAPLRRMIFGLVRRGMLTLSADGSAQITGYNNDERWDDCPVWQHYGLASRPPTGSIVALLSLGADTDAAMVVASEHDTHRPTGLEEGDAILYGLDDGGQASVATLAAGDVVVSAPGTIQLGGTSEAAIKGMSFVAPFTPMVAATDPASTMALVNAILAALKAAPLSTKVTLA